MSPDLQGGMAGETAAVRADLDERWEALVGVPRTSCLDGFGFCYARRCPDQNRGGKMTYLYQESKGGTTRVCFVGLSLVFVLLSLL